MKRVDCGMYSVILIKTTSGKHFVAKAIKIEGDNLILQEQRSICKGNSLLCPNNLDMHFTADYGKCKWIPLESIEEWRYASPLDVFKYGRYKPIQVKKDEDWLDIAFNRYDGGFCKGVDTVAL